MSKFEALFEDEDNIFGGTPESKYHDIASQANDEIVKNEFNTSCCGKNLIFIQTARMMMLIIRIITIIIMMMIIIIIIIRLEPRHWHLQYYLTG